VRSRCSPSLASFVFGVLCGKRRTHNKAASTLYLRLIALKTVLSIQSFQSTLQASLDSARQRTVRSRLMKFEGGTLGRARCLYVRPPDVQPQPDGCGICGGSLCSAAANAASPVLIQSWHRPASIMSFRSPTSNWQLTILRTHAAGRRASPSHKL
jgi:hypothetical protein